MPYPTRNAIIVDAAPGSNVAKNPNMQNRKTPARAAVSKMRRNRFMVGLATPKDYEVERGTSMPGKPGGARGKPDLAAGSRSDWRVAKLQELQMTDPYGPTMAMLLLAGVSAGLNNVLFNWFPFSQYADPPFSTTTMPFVPKGGTSFRTSGPSPPGKVPGS